MWNLDNTTVKFQITRSWHVPCQFHFISFKQHYYIIIKLVGRIGFNENFILLLARFLFSLIFFGFLLPQLCVFGLDVRLLWDIILNLTLTRFWVFYIVFWTLPIFYEFLWQKKKTLLLRKNMLFVIFQIYIFNNNNNKLNWTWILLKLWAHFLNRFYIKIIWS